MHKIREMINEESFLEGTLLGGFGITESLLKTLGDKIIKGTIGLEINMQIMKDIHYFNSMGEEPKRDREHSNLLSLHTTYKICDLLDEELEGFTDAQKGIITCKICEFVLDYTKRMIERLTIGESSLRSNPLDRLKELLERHLLDSRS